MPNALADEARSMTDSELGEAINEAYREVFNLQFQRGTRQLQNPMAMRQARRQVARLRTILRERHLAEAAGMPIEPLARVADVQEVDELEEPAESVEQPDDAASEEE
ncbi:MAG: 50S ribosomal protein L29 [Chloroflexi bacterium]|nr:50S ribosomal protein L29 [Chloroflexota bacterium]MCY3587585.1 50S ribosomal protein L29 [Chloroflexota bacterium]MCY3686591.1 50S ribosomal protein L29 [Chloroflexota bacterium]MDE2707979.1 50S ribosomal protein L29 [Chloroflexota bacterium]